MQNLSLYILRLMIVASSAGQGGIVSLAQFRRVNKIPPTTFHRHVTDLIEHGFIDRVGRDKYCLKSAFKSLVLMASQHPPVASKFDTTVWTGAKF